MGLDFLEQFYIYSKIKGKLQIYHIYASPYTCIVSPIINVPHQNGTFIKVDEPTLTQRNHPKSIIFFKLYSCCCIVYGFGEIYNDTYPSLQYHTEQFHCLKHPVLHLFIPLFFSSGTLLKSMISLHTPDLTQPN